MRRFSLRLTDIKINADEIRTKIYQKLNFVRGFSLRLKFLLCKPGRIFEPLEILSRFNRQKLPLHIFLKIQ